ncbi:hypothetical protein FHG87_011056 [Trinorchestia longiramus]|nr:hypothetical protein FHG87_011056 [Trinorchestia longiramus]
MRDDAAREPSRTQSDGNISLPTNSSATCHSRSITNSSATSHSRSITNSSPTSHSRSITNSSATSHSRSITNSSPTSHSRSITNSSATSHSRSITNSSPTSHSCSTTNSNPTSDTGPAGDVRLPNGFNEIVEFINVDSVSALVSPVAHSDDGNVSVGDIVTVEAPELDCRNSTGTPPAALPALTDAEMREQAQNMDPYTCALMSSIAQTDVMWSVRREEFNEILHFPLHEANRIFGGYHKYLSSDMAGRLQNISSSCLVRPNSLDGRCSLRNLLTARWQFNGALSSWKSELSSDQLGRLVSPAWSTGITSLVDWLSPAWSTGYHQLGRLVSESASERKDPGSNPAADMVDVARNTA